MELERRAPSVRDHIVHSRDAEDVGDLVRVGHGRDRAMPNGEAGKLARGHHRAFDVNVRIHEAWQQEPACQTDRLDRGDGIPRYREPHRIDAASRDVDEIGGQRDGRHSPTIAACPIVVKPEIGTTIALKVERIRRRKSIAAGRPDSRQEPRHTLTTLTAQDGPDAGFTRIGVLP